MARRTVTTAGYYGGRFLAVGASYDAPDEPETDLAKMTKAELLAEAERRGVEVKADGTKAEILAALEGAA